MLTQMSRRLCWPASVSLQSFKLIDVMIAYHYYLRVMPGRRRFFDFHSSFVINTSLPLLLTMPRCHLPHASALPPLHAAINVQQLQGFAPAFRRATMFGRFRRRNNRLALACFLIVKTFRRHMIMLITTPPARHDVCISTNTP